MKKLTISFAALFSGYASHAFAQLPVAPTTVTAPTYSGSFSFGLTGLYWRAANTHLDYALSYPSFDSAGGFLFTDGVSHSVDHDYDWGFKANIGYLFACSGNELKLSYTHWQNNEHDNVNNDGFLLPALAAPFFLSPLTVAFGDAPLTGEALVGIPDLAILPSILSGTFPLTVTLDATNLLGISARSRLENHTWDLDYSQQLAMGSRLNLKWFGGLRYSSLNHRIEVAQDIAFSDTVVFDPTPIEVALEITAVFPTVLIAIGTIAPVFDIDVTLRDVINQKSDFNGIGPRFGFDAGYHIGNGLGVIASVATALLVGEAETSYLQCIQTVGVAVLDPDLTAFDLEETLVAGFPVFDPEITGSTAPLVTTTLTTFSYRHPHKTRIVPNIDAKLGLNWSYVFCNPNRSAVSIEAGYMVSYYFNAIDVVGETGLLAPELNSRRINDISFEGPYVGIQVRL